MPDQRRGIVTAASRVLERDGVDAVTFRSVADEANYSRGAIQHHFASRRELLDQLHIAAVESWATLMKTGREQTGIMDRIDQDAPVLDAIDNFKSEMPGTWDLLRTRRCPDFDAETAPNAWALLHDLFKGEPWDRIGPVADVVFGCSIVLHEMIAAAPDSEQERIRSNVVAPKLINLIFR